MSNFKQIDKSVIDFNNIYGNSTDAMMGNNNTISVNPQYWGDNGTLMFDESTGLITENGVGLGYMNPAALSQASASTVTSDLTSLQPQATIPTVDPNLASSAAGIQSIAAPTVDIPDMTQLLANMQAATPAAPTMPTVDQTMTFPTTPTSTDLTAAYNQLLAANTASIQSVVPTTNYDQILASMQAATVATDITAPVTQMVPDMSQFATVQPTVDTTGLFNQTAGVTGSVGGSLSPGTSASTYAATPYQLDPAARNELLALVYSEATEKPDYITSDTMGVTSTILNRLEAGKWGSTVHDVISSKGQFSGYKNKKFNAAMANPGIIKPEMVAAVDAVLAGQRNTNGLFFTGNGVYNKFR